MSWLCGSDVAQNLYAAVVRIYDVDSIIVIDEEARGQLKFFWTVAGAAKVIKELPVLVEHLDEIFEAIYDVEMVLAWL